MPRIGVVRAHYLILALSQAYLAIGSLTWTTRESVPTRPKQVRLERITHLLLGF